MKRNKAGLLLVFIPLLIPLLIIFWEVQQDGKISNYTVGGFQYSQEGERKAMQKLFKLLEEGERGQIRVGWSVTILSPKAKRGSTLYSIEFKTRENRLIYRILSPKQSQPLKILYDHTTEENIGSVARSGGLAKDLIKNGAVVKF